VQDVYNEHRLMLSTVPESSDSNVTDKRTTPAGDRGSRDSDVTSASVQSRSYGDGGRFVFFGQRNVASQT